MVSVELDAIHVDDEAGVGVQTHEEASVVGPGGQLELLSEEPDAGSGLGGDGHLRPALVVEGALSPGRVEGRVDELVPPVVVRPD